jgi:hypothetical protein
MRRSPVCLDGYRRGEYTELLSRRKHPARSSAESPLKRIRRSCELFVRLNDAMESSSIMRDSSTVWSSSTVLDDENAYAMPRPRLPKDGDR